MITYTTSLNMESSNHRSELHTLLRPEPPNPHSKLPTSELQTLKPRASSAPKRKQTCETLKTLHRAQTPTQSPNTPNPKSFTTLLKAHKGPKALRTREPQIARRGQLPGRRGSGSEAKLHGRRAGPRLLQGIYKQGFYLEWGWGTSASLNAVYAGHHWGDRRSSR